MIISLSYTRSFEAQFKRFKKKYASLESDFKIFINNINLEKSVDLGGGLHKYRLLVKSKNKGKSGGFRVVSFEALIAEHHKKFTLLDIYDKSEKSNVSKKEMIEILQNEGII